MMSILDRSTGATGTDRLAVSADHARLRRRLRQGAVASVAVVIAAYVSVLYRVVDVAGGVLELAVILTGAVALATLLARNERSGSRGRLRSSTVFVLATLLLGAGLVAYLAVLPPEERALVTPVQILADTYSMLTGMSVLRLVRAGSWALGIAPAPTFLTWYLSLRGDYPAAAAVSGALLGLFVLTGDAGIPTTLAGSAGVASAVALSSLVRAAEGTATSTDTAGTTRSDPAAFRRHVRTQVELVVVVLAAMILLSAAIGTAVGGGNSQAAGGGLGGSTTGTTGVTQASLVNTSDQIAVSGSISLSPQVRLLVRSDQSALWRTAAYDRYTGDGWVRTGQTQPYENDLAAPPGNTEQIEQTVEPQTRLNAMPAANRPVSVESQQAERTLVTTQGTVEPAETLAVGDNYTVVSQQPRVDPDALRAADDYGSDVDRYRQLPESTPDRVSERSAAVAGEEETAYDKAVAIEQHLEGAKEYSTIVERPEGDVADGFLFEMDAGYCTYFATTMAVMLRSQDVPARVAVGYTSGQRVPTENGTDTHVVRGYDAHAWVEVYFEGVGWVTFDPTPSGPRETVENQRLTRAREESTLAVDAAGSSSVDVEVNSTESTADFALDSNETAAQSQPGERELPLPAPRTIGLWLVGLVGAAAVTRRSGLGVRALRATRRYYQRRHSPSVDIERAWERVEADLGRRRRARKPSETARSYVRALAADSAVDPDVYKVLDRYEQARYGGRTDRETADTAIEHADALTRKRLPLIGRRYRR